MKRAFTLVELLTVIFLIALLISILLPSVNIAREQANSVVCMSHMRQIVASMLNYASDNKGIFGDPPSICDDDPYRPGINQFGVPYMSKIYFMKSLGIIRYDCGTFWPYIANSNRITPQTMSGSNSRRSNANKAHF